MFLASCATYKSYVCSGKNELGSYQNIYIKTNKYEGVIFSKDYNAFWPLNGGEFTPTLEDIRITETLLRKGIKTLNSQRINQIDHCPIIDKNLRKYRRQYFGKIDANGDRIVVINCFWEKGTFSDFLDCVLLKKEFNDKWKTEVVQVFDGCSYYWSIKANLTQMNLFDLNINGIG